MAGNELALASSVWMIPNCIKFTQSTISKVFSRRKAAAAFSYADAVKASEADTGPQTLENLLEQLKSGEVKVTDIPPIRVHYHKDVPYSLDNRRLWVFCCLGQPIPVEVVKDGAKEFFQKWDPESAGDFESVSFIGSSPQGKDKFHDDSVVHHMLSWSVSNITQEKLHVNKADPLPLTFSSRRQYLRSFRWPLLEEARATIYHKLEQKIPVESWHRVTLHECPTKEDTLKFKSFAMELSAGGAYKPRTQDLFMFSTTAARFTVEELNAPGIHYALGIITQATEEDCDRVSMTGRLYVPSGSEEYSAIQDDGKSWYAFYIANLATKLRIWEALESLSCPEKQLPPLVEEILEPALGSQISNSVHRYTPDMAQAVLTYCDDVRALNASQTEAVVNVVSGLVNKVWPRIRLVQGPPGTGKTSLLVTLLCILGSMNYRIHMCAPTNTAICEIASRFVSQMLPDTVSQHQSAQFGAWPAGGATNSGMRKRILHLGDVALIGNEEKIKYNEDKFLDSIYLPRRASRLREALSPGTGYKHLVQSWIQFLKSDIVEYEVQKRCEEEALDASEKLPKSLFTFVTGKLKVLGPGLIEKCGILCNDLPSHFLPFETKVQLQAISNHVTQITDYLTSTEMSDDQVRRWLASARVTDCQEERGTAEFENCLQVKIQLLKLLEKRPGFDVFVGKVLSEDELQRVCLKHAVLLFSTVSTGGKNIVVHAGPFDCVVVDEASQLVEAETLVVLRSFSLQQLILVGDHEQLPATVISKVASSWEYGRSLFKRLHKLNHPCQLLDVQYRMHPEISIFPNNQFYHGRLKDGPNVLSDEYSNKPFQCTILKTYSFLDIKDGSEHQEMGKPSFMNLVEVKIVMHLIAKLNKVCAENNYVLTVGVLAPYSAQVQAITKQIDAFEAKFCNLIVEVQSVDGLQGREKDVVIFSAVRASRDRGIGFLQYYERLNVAITRGRYCVWILGNAATLSRNDVWNSLIENAKERKCFIVPDDDMLRVIRRAKISSDEFVELLKPTSTVFNNTMWKATFSVELKRTLLSIKSTDARHKLLCVMLDIAQGKLATRYQWDVTASLCSKIAQVRPTAKLFLVWSVDLEFVPQVKQVLKFWDAVAQPRLRPLLKRLEAGFATCTDAYLNRCLVRQEAGRGTVVIPKVWEQDDGFIPYKALDRDVVQPNDPMDDSMLEKTYVDESILQMKFFALNSGIAHQLITGVDGSNFELPFVVNDDEARIIGYPKSSFIIGRSGTGKTTVLTTKLLQRQQQFLLAERGFQDTERSNDALDGPKDTGAKSDRALRQALVTRSPKLCAAIKNHINKIQRALEGAEKGAVLSKSSEDELKLYDDDEETLQGSVPNSFLDVPSDSFPLIITFSKLLYMIEGCLENKFLTSDEHVLRESADEVGSDSICSPVLWTRDEVHESTICMMRETPDDNRLVDDDESQRTSSNDGRKVCPGVQTLQGGGARLLLRKDRPRLEVDFVRFSTVYWAHLNQAVKSKFDPSLIYGEIMSCIKGSLAALRSPKKCIEKHDYINLASARTSMLNEGLRENIYSLYLQYENLKRNRNEYDLADYVMHLHRELEGGACGGPFLDYLYVDEVQDLTPAQIALFKYVCHDVQEGFMFAGDTAQTIGKGMGFRFEDVRNLFYVEFLGNNIEGVGDASQLDTAHGGVGKSRSRSSSSVPDMHYLSRNFRTHVGIVKIANSIVELMWHFFPYAIDKLKPETSLLFGEAPLCLEIKKNHDLVTALFNRGKMGGGGCEFGAEQAILVRDESRKQAMLSNLDAVKKTCLVLTVDECKGLEFQDVLLYNFFADSVCGRMWRVIYDAFQNGAILSAQEKQHLAPFKFEYTKHSALCTELKLLYVAVTRARQRLWICDDDVNSQQPMLDYWRAKKLVQVQPVDDSLAEDFTRKSSPDEWKKQGVKLFERRLFTRAKFCFDKAGDVVYAKVAEAEDLLQAANRPGFALDKVESSRQTALVIFLEVKKMDRAAYCCRILRDFMQAGSILEKIGKFEEAGARYAEGKHFLEAANAYHQGRCYEQCLDSCWRGKVLDAGLDFMKQWELSTDGGNAQAEASSLDSIRVAYLQKCAEYHKKLGAAREMMKYVNCLPTMDLKRVVLRENFLGELLALEEAAECFAEAEKIAEELGHWEQSADLSVKAGNAEQGVLKLLHLAQLEICWGKGDGKALIGKAEGIARDHPEMGTLSMLEMDIMKVYMSGKRGQWLSSWDKLRSLPDLRLEILVGKFVICDILDNMLPSPGLLTYKIAELPHLPVFDRCEAAMEGMQLVVICKKLWAIWSDRISLVLEALETSRENTSEANASALQSCFDLLGARSRSTGALYLKSPKASWLKGQRTDRRGEMSKRDLMTSALRHWKNEVLQLAHRLLKTGKEVLDEHDACTQISGTDADIRFRTAIEMVDIFHVIDIMNLVSVELGNLYRDWCVRVQDMLHDRKGLVYGSRRPDVVVAVLDTMFVKASKRSDIASVLRLYPFISRYCFSVMSSVAIKSRVACTLMDSWHLYRDNWPEQPMTCEKLAAFLRVNYLTQWDDPILACCRAEKVVVSICSVYTHVRGLIIPAKLAHSYMTGPNQESLYIDAARFPCDTYGHQSVVDICDEVIQDILFWIPEWEFKAYRFRLFTVVLILLINVHDASLRKRTLSTLQMLLKSRTHRMWECPPPQVNRADLESLGNLLRVGPNLRIAQVGQAFARAVASYDPLVVLNFGSGSPPLPAWVQRDLPSVGLAKDASGRLVFGDTDTVLGFESTSFVGIASPRLLGSLEESNLNLLASCFSREPSIQAESSVASARPVEDCDEDYNEDYDNEMRTAGDGQAGSHIRSPTTEAAVEPTRGGLKDNRSVTADNQPEIAKTKSKKKGGKGKKKKSR